MLVVEIVETGQDGIAKVRVATLDQLSYELVSRYAKIGTGRTG